MRTVKKSLAILLSLTVLITTAGCSIGGQDVISQESKDKLIQKATDAVNKLKENQDLQQFLLNQTGATSAKVEQWKNDLMQEQIVQQALEQLGQDVVRQVIQQAVVDNNGDLNDILITVITNELKKRMQGQ
jgi:hypothetical protein